MLFSFVAVGWGYGQGGGTRCLRLSSAMQLYLNSNDLSGVIADVVHRPNVLYAAKDEFIDSLSFLSVLPHVIDSLDVVEMRCAEPK